MSGESSTLKLLSCTSKTNNLATTTLRRMTRQQVQNQPHNRTDGGEGVLDFLRVKNGVMLSYLIDLTLMLRFRLNGANPRQRQLGAGDAGSRSGSGSGSDDAPQPEPQRQCLERLLEMQAVLGKLRPLEKRMRYQIDKLLALSTLGASTFAAVGREQEEGEDEGQGKSRDEGVSLDDEQTEGEARAHRDVALESDPLSFKPDLQGMMSMFEEDEHEVSLY